MLFDRVKHPTIPMKFPTFLRPISMYPQLTDIGSFRAVRKYPITFHPLPGPSGGAVLRRPSETVGGSLENLYGMELRSGGYLVPALLRITYIILYTVSFKED